MYRTTTKYYSNDSESKEQPYKMSDNSQPASPCSYNKMNIGTKNIKPAASTASESEKTQPIKLINRISKITHSLRLSKDETPIERYKGLREKHDPERRKVHRRSSLLPKSKALLRVIDQADEDTRLSDIEMHREKDLQFKIADFTQDIPAASWTRLLEFPYYQSSRLNPEVEMNVKLIKEKTRQLTKNQQDNLPIQQNYRTIKRKASEDRFEPYPSFTLKRRAVSPSVSLSGSSISTSISSPTYSSTAKSHPNRPIDNSTFTLQDASGGLSRMSLSE